MIPVNEPVISSEAKANVSEALNTGWLSSAGPYVKKFEDEFAAFIGVKHAISVNTGTAALHVALLAAGIGEGDEVIVPAFTMAATYLAVIYTGAKPVFVDADPITYNLDPNLIEAKITDRTKAILPVHVYGHPAQMDKVMGLAGKYHLLVIEDAAEAHGATYHGKIVGGIGDIGCFSFYANKLVTTGEGGMVVTNNDTFAAEAAKFKDLYHSPAKRFIHEKIGYNYRLTNLQAAVGLGELGHLQEYIAKKQAMATRYSQALSQIKGIITPHTSSDVTNVFWMYAIRLTEDFPLSKDELRQKLLGSYGIDTRDFFYSPLDQPILKPYLSKQDSFPVTKLIADTGLYLPSGLAITTEQIDTVIAAIKELS
ncbi:MAG: hypothetical protein ACD_40C00213G0015 [uncultured bacterium]|nr:MAG: hypothetical protein ACD_40C00213G0015 [uncultured bacterium]KKU26449.1 MAG: DegT/DnrJ/EryC1/StrS aminotransferase [Microgenomates group bacterium GW2011_GWA2_46_16]